MLTQKKTSQTEKEVTRSEAGSIPPNLLSHSTHSTSEAKYVRMYNTYEYTYVHTSNSSPYKVIEYVLTYYTNAVTC